MVKCLTVLSGIKMVSFKGSPVCLAKDYRAILKQRFQQLKMLDGTPAFSEAEEALKKKRKKKFDAYGNEIKDTSDQIEITSEINLEINFRLLQHVSGVYLVPGENCAADFDPTPLEPEQKSSAFYLRYTNHLGE